MFNRYGPSRDPQRKQTLDFRYQLTHDVLQALHRGECVSVVGVGSSGKSRLLLHVTRPETVEYHLGDGAYNHFFVLVPCNAWMGDELWAAYEGITRNLNDYLENTTNPGLQAARRELEGMYDAVTREKDLALKHLMTGLGYLLGNARLKLTLCFDEFDYVFEKFEPALFRNLRAIRNQHKYQLTYLVATRRQMPYQRPREAWADVEEFFELFSDHTYAIGPLDDKDAGEMLLDLERRYEFALSKNLRTLVVSVTGGHPGLIGAAFRHLEGARQSPAPAHEGQLLRELAAEPAMGSECRKIWETLLPEEQAALRRLATHGRPGRDDADTITALKAKGLIRDSARGALVFFSPIFQEFARRAPDD